MATTGPPTPLRPERRRRPPRCPSATATRSGPTTRGATTLGIVGVIVGGLVWLIVLAFASLSVSYCSTSISDASVVWRARVWLLGATLLWIAGPLIAARRHRRVGRRPVFWFVVAAISGLIGAWSIVAIEPWSLSPM